MWFSASAKLGIDLPEMTGAFEHGGLAATSLRGLGGTRTPSKTHFFGEEAVGECLLSSRAC